MPNTIEQFLKHVEKTPTCWRWTAAIGAGGYGVSHWGRDVETAPRTAYRLFRGWSVPKGKVLRHTCDNRWCVNPDHLVVGTYRENLEDAVAAGRRTDIRRLLTPIDVMEIKRLIKAGKKQKEVAVQFNCSQGHISRLMSGKLKTRNKENQYG